MRIQPTCFATSTKSASACWRLKHATVPVMVLSLNGAMRRSLLAASRSPGLSRLGRRYGRFAAYRFVAGETLDDSVQVLRRLKAAGFQTNTTLLAESIGHAATA